MSKPSGNPGSPPERHRRIKQAIWLYFFLLVFEGALRKWILPGFATPLLVVRDPIAIWLIVACYQRGLFKVNFYTVGMWFIGFVSLCTALLFGHKNIYVALFGLRILVLYFPLIFVIARVFDRRDAIEMGKVVLWLTIPMTVLMAVQFYSPQSSWVNRGVGDDAEGAGFSGAMGFFRPPGTFSFTNGLALFYGLTAAYIFYFWLSQSKTVKKWLLIVATGCLIIALPLSISRTLFLQTMLSAAFAAVVASYKPKQLMPFILAVVSGAILLSVFSSLEFFQIGLEAFTDRFETANKIEGGIEKIFVNRFLGGMTGAIVESSKIPFWGYGIGLGTNVGAMLTTGSAAFLVAEGEWGRIVGESGLLLGLAAIFLRTALTIKMSVQSFRALHKGNLLPWMLLSFGGLIILQGQWAQPTALGFATLTGGLILASLKKPGMIRENIA